MTIALQDTQGNILTDSDSADTAPLDAVVTYVSRADPTPISIGSPTPIVSGVAIIAGLSMPGPGVYHLIVEVKEYSATLSYLFVLRPQLIGQSVDFVATPSG